MTELSKQQIDARADKLIEDINYAEMTGLSEDTVRRLYEAWDRLNERAIAAGFGAL